MILRSYQTRAVNNSVTALKKHKNTMLVSATGSGKTVILSDIARKIIGNNGKKTLILAHRDELTKQNSNTFMKVNPGMPVSLYNADRKSWRGKAIFSMVQTLSRNHNLESMPPIDLLIYDECHHVASNSYRKITARAKELNPKVEILGVTATPERSDSKGLKDTFNNVADIITINELVKIGHLVPPKGMVIDIGTQNALKQVKKTANDYDMYEVEAIQNTNINNKQIVEKWKELAKYVSSVGFCATIQHSIDVRDAFREEGIEAEAVHSEVSKKERRAILHAFDRGDIPVLLNPAILTEGWDCQICGCIMLFRTSSHKSIVIQMVGRGLRKVDPRRYPGKVKRDCLILDFGISLLECGDLNSEVNLKYDKTKDPDSESKKKNCPDCNSELPIQIRTCPLCDYEFKVKLDEDGFYNEFEELKLIEIDLINNSPFRWISLFSGDRISIASGFSAWACVCSPEGENWYALGGKGKQVEVLTIANRIGAVSSADDFMRQNESGRNAKKAAVWMLEPASPKQSQLLSRFGYNQNMVKVEAAAHITFRFNQHKIEKLMGL